MVVRGRFKEIVMTQKGYSIVECQSYGMKITFTRPGYFCAKDCLGSDEMYP